MVSLHSSWSDVSNDMQYGVLNPLQELKNAYEFLTLYIHLIQ